MEGELFSFRKVYGTEKVLFPVEVQEDCTHVMQKARKVDVEGIGIAKPFSDDLCHLGHA